MLSILTTSYAYSKELAQYKKLFGKNLGRLITKLPT
jgi:hypothetical protein